MIKKGLKVVVILLALISSTCKNEHPQLEDGLYAEFITSKGTMIAKLHYDKVPVTVANFVALAEGNHPLVEEKYKNKPFYDNLIFHRVINNFMIQGGDPLGTGAGTPGYRFVADFSPELKHDKPGILSMANAGGIDTNGSQFFITETKYTRGDFYDANGNLKPCDQRGVSCHSVFGELVEGLNVQDSISNVKVVNPMAQNHKPVDDVVLTKVNIIRKGKEARKFDAPKVFEENMPKVEAKFKAIREKAKKKAEAKAKAAKADFIKINDDLKNALITSETGIKIGYIKKGDGPKPTSDQKVKIECAGHFENGELFWTTWKDVAEKFGKYDPVQDQRGLYKAFEQPFNQTATLIAGFKEAMLKMRVGDIVRVYIPYHLGYGDAGSPPVIPPKSNLVFDIQLKEIAE